MTTGSATRRALRAARSPAAATEGIVHLPGPPERTPRGLDVLAHELSHVADQDRRPRMFGEELLDMGERQARRIGSAAGSSAERGIRGAERSDRGIDNRPVGGAAAVIPAAVRAAEQILAGNEAPEEFPMDLAKAYMSGDRQGERPGPGRSAEAAPGGPAQRGAARHPAAAGHEVGEGPHRAAGDAGPAVAAIDQSGHVDAMIEAIEQRLLAEMERRGGRFQGLF